MCDFISGFWKAWYITNWKMEHNSLGIGIKISHSQVKYIITFSKSESLNILAGIANFISRMINWILLAIQLESWKISDIIWEIETETVLRKTFFLDNSNEIYIFCLSKRNPFINSNLRESHGSGNINRVTLLIDHTLNLCTSV